MTKQSHKKTTKALFKSYNDYNDSKGPADIAYTIVKYGERQRPQRDTNIRRIEDK